MNDTDPQLARIAALLEKTSLGTPAAREARSRIPLERAQRIAGVTNDDHTHTSVKVMRIPHGRRRRHRWRWNVTAFRLDANTSPGVFDHWVHLNSWFGYTLTRRGALRAACRHVGVT